MRTTSRILQILDMSYEEYDAWQWEHFINWCYDKSAGFAIPVKALMINDHLLNWYQEQWSYTVESEFINDNSAFLDIAAPAIYFDLITTYPDELLNTYPLPILKMIKKNLKAA